MAEPYNFSGHLRSVVRPTLVRMSFGLKATKFRRETDIAIETVYFQRSSWNIPYLPFEFYLNLEVKSDAVTAMNRLDRPTTVPIPECYRRFFNESPEQFPVEERKRVMDSLRPDQRTAIDRYTDSRRWIYSSEDELRSNIHLAVELLDACLDRIFLTTADRFKAAKTAADCQTVLREVIEYEYLGYIPEHSRWVEV